MSPVTWWSGPEAFTYDGKGKFLVKLFSVAILPFVILACLLFSAIYEIGRRLTPKRKNP